MLGEDRHLKIGRCSVHFGYMTDGRYEIWGQKVCDGKETARWGDEILCESVMSASSEVGRERRGMGDDQGAHI